MSDEEFTELDRGRGIHERGGGQRTKGSEVDVDPIKLVRQIDVPLSIHKAPDDQESGQPRPDDQTNERAHVIHSHQLSNPFGGLRPPFLRLYSSTASFNVRLCRDRFAFHRSRPRSISWRTGWWVAGRLRSTVRRPLSMRWCEGRRTLVGEDEEEALERKGRER